MIESTQFTRVRCCAASLAVAAASAASPVIAQPSPSPAPYRSAFEGYRAWSAAAPAADWRAVNAEMLRLGGHAGHLRDASTKREGAKPADTPPSSPPAGREPNAAGKSR